MFDFFNQHCDKDTICKAVEALALSYNIWALGEVMVRMDVAAYPMHGETGDVVLQMADAAFYKTCPSENVMWLLRNNSGNAGG